MTEDKKFGFIYCGETRPEIIDKLRDELTNNTWIIQNNTWIIHRPIPENNGE